jgi:hypothetical protein
VDYSELVELIPAEKWGPVSDQLTNLILASKNEEKMPRHLADVILLHMKNDNIESKSGLAALLEASMLLEPEKAMNAFSELQLPTVAEQIKAKIATMTAEAL